MIILGKGGMAREAKVYYGSGAEMMTTNEFELRIETAKTPLDTPVIIAIGDPKARKKIYEFYTYHNWVKYWATFDYGKQYGRCKIGEGSILCPGSIITTDVTIGTHCIVNVNAAIHHDTIIGNYVTISPGATICGNVKIGEGCFIGAGAIIREKIKICDNVFIGAGAVVVKDINFPGIYIGTPAREMPPKSRAVLD